MKIHNKKSNRCLKTVFFLIFILPLTCLDARKVIVEGLNFYLSEETHEAIIDSENTWAGELVLPSEINYDGQGYIVKGISWCAFYNCKELTRVRIPKTIENVIHYELSNEYPSAVSPDYMNPFVGCTSLVSIEVDEDNPIMSSKEGVMFSKDGTKLYAYPAGNKQENYAVPQGVTYIGGASFSYSADLVSVELPETVERMYSAFNECRNLKKINLPKKLAYLDAYTFKNCSSLESIEIPNGVRGIGEQTFSGCVSMKTIDMPESIQTIGSLAFRECKLDALIIRGILENQSLNRSLFSGLDESTKLYVPTSEIERYKKIYAGPILPLDSYSGSSETTEDPINCRPFVEEGKTWTLCCLKDGADPTEKIPGRIEYQYLQGDTLIGGLRYKRWWIDRGENVPPLYAGAAREEELVVFFCPPGKTESQVIYDFSSPAGTIGWYNNFYSILTVIYDVTLGENRIINTETYKGWCRDVSFNGTTVTWLQGVGYMGLVNLPFGGYILLSCTVGNEVLYYDASLMEKPGDEVKKKKLDFTHVIKAQPRAPRLRIQQQDGDMPQDEETLQGEYSDTELFVRLNPLAGYYTATLTDASGRVVYRKTLLTDNVLALNTELTAYGPGNYVLTLENDEEAYTATLSIEPNGIENLRPTPSPSRNGGELYDLQGRRLMKAPEKGLYIQDGQIKMIK